MVDASKRNLSRECELRPQQSVVVDARGRKGALLMLAGEEEWTRPELRAGAG